MLRKLTLHNWKSFRESSLNIDQLTILIGTNASGKSNPLDALEFLNRIASATDISTALSGDASTEQIRGGIDWAAYGQEDSFSISVLIGTDDERTDYEYEIAITLEGGAAELSGEQLTRIKYQGKNPRRLRLFWTDQPQGESPGIIARVYNTKAGTKKPLRRNLSILSQLEVDPDIPDVITEGIVVVLGNLRRIFILDPKPSSMRSFSRSNEELKKDGSNIAGVLMALPEEMRTGVEDQITRLASKIPEKDIKRVWAEHVGRHKTDAMLYCLKEWAEKGEFEVDARGMSDGTLRFIAVFGALLLRPEKSTVVIEEIDIGLHPSRALLLLNAVSEIAQDRGIDILITTHNVALLDSLPPSLIRSISVATRSDKNGSSQIISLDDVPLLSRVMAEGEVGTLFRRGQLKTSIKKFMEDARSSRRDRHRSFLLLA
jgi:predicted ATPase